MAVSSPGLVTGLVTGPVTGSPLPGGSDPSSCRSSSGQTGHSGSYGQMDQSCHSVQRQTKMEDKVVMKENKVIKKEDEPKKEFRCEECGRNFPAKQNLGAHKRRYHKNTVFTCYFEGCDKTYKQK